MGDHRISDADHDRGLHKHNYLFSCYKCQWERDRKEQMSDIELLSEEHYTDGHRFYVDDCPRCLEAREQHDYQSRCY